MTASFTCFVHVRFCPRPYHSTILLTTLTRSIWWTFELNVDVKLSLSFGWALCVYFVCLVFSIFFFFVRHCLLRIWSIYPMVFCSVKISQPVSCNIPGYLVPGALIELPHGLLLWLWKFPSLCLAIYLVPGVRYYYLYSHFFCRPPHLTLTKTFH